MKALLGPLCLVALTLGCVSGGPLAPAGGGNGATAQGLMPEVITAQPIDAAPVSDAAQLPAEAEAPAAPQGAEPSGRQDAPAPPLDPAAEPAAAATPADPEAPISPEHAACLKRGDLWVRIGDSILFACIRKTRDAGKQCTRGGDCEGECLARSMTCAPFDPLLGCNEILQDDGVRVTLCLN